MRSTAPAFEDVVGFLEGVVGRILRARQNRGEEFCGGRSAGEFLARRLDLVTREEFEVLRAMVAKFRAQQEDISVRVAILESLAGITPSRDGVKQKTNTKAYSYSVKKSPKKKG